MLSLSAERILQQRYYQPGETWEKLVQRVVTDVCKSENSEFKQVMANYLNDTLFLPNSPCLVNSGTSRGKFACFVVGPTEDTLENHLETLKDIAQVAKFGGGAGYTGTFVRPKNKPVNGSTHGYSYGPNAWASKVSDYMDMMTQSGFRKMALMYTLSSNHEDLDEFINLKQSGVETHLYNFNQSIFATDVFMNLALQENTKQHEQLVKLATNAWNNGEPGLLFDDTINNNTPYSASGQRIFATNPSLRKGTKIVTDLGIFPIEELENREFKVINLNGEWSDAECFLSGENKRLWKLTLSGGVEYYCTKEHKWPIYDGEYFKKVTTNELEVGQKLPVNLTSKTFGTVGEYSDGFLAGWIMGDGWLTKRTNNGKVQVGIIISQHDKDNGIFDLIQEKLHELGIFNDFSERARDGGKTWYEVNITNKLLTRWCEKFGVTNKKEGLSDFIWNEASKEFTYGFLDGLFSSDGSVSRNDRKIDFSTVHKKLADDLHELLGFLGIVASKRKVVKNTNFKENFTAYVIKFSNKFIKFLSHKDKNSRLSSKQLLVRKTYQREILSIEETELFEDVWDISVYDETHCFALANVITGNCGEQCLPPYGSCNLGSINVSHQNLLTNGLFNFSKLEEVVWNCTTFLEDVGMTNFFPNHKFSNWYENNRPIGLGIMGFADLLLNLEIIYGSNESLKLLSKIMETLKEVSYAKSKLLGKERGIPEACKEFGRRNITTTTIAPTGSISFIADCSSAIEPIFSPEYTRIDERGERYTIVHLDADKPYFVSVIGSKISPTWKQHVDVQLTAQKFVDAAISKTVNLPNEATIDTVYSVFEYAYLNGAKGITVYRDNSRQFQVLNDNKVKETLQILEENCGDGCNWVKVGKCSTCSVCGSSKCEL